MMDARADIIARSETKLTVGGLPTPSWPSAEHRVRPEQMETQIGLRQGAAGVGLSLIPLEGQRKGFGRFSIFEEPF